MLWMRTWRLGIKSVMLHPMRSFLTILGILIGVASVIGLLAIGEGFSQGAQKQIEDLGADNIMVRSVKPTTTSSVSGGSFILTYGLTREDYDRLVETIPTITSALPIREMKREVRYGSQDPVDARLVGCTPEYAEVKGG